MTWVLAVDFGTTNTVAAVADADGVRVLNVNGRPVMPSAVFLHDEGWYVGDTAVRMARHRFDRFEACPKRAIPDGTLFLGGHDVPVAHAITALLRPLLTEAAEQHGWQPPALFVVTHPATWTASRINVLLSAAAAAVPGLSSPLLSSLSTSLQPLPPYPSRGMSGGVPGVTAGEVPGGVPGGMSGGMSGGVPGGVPGGAPGGMSGGVPGGMSSGMSGGVLWPRPQPLSEPVAAAQRVLYLRNMPVSARLVVLDLGGGTTDVTVVDRHGAQLVVAGNPLGRDGLGGVDFDLRLARWMVAEVRAPGLYDRLAGAGDPELRERAVDIREHARDVKEQLSQQAVVPAQLPKSPPELPASTPVQVSRPMLETLIRGTTEEPGLDQAVTLVHDALRAAPPGPELAGVFLVGGSSRIPLLGALITHQVGRVPIRHGDPTTAVAEGAALYGWRALHAMPAVPPPAPPRRRGNRAKIALLVFLFALLVGGGIFTYFQVSSSNSPDSPDPPAPSSSSYGTAVVPVDVYESPSLNAPVVGSLSAGERVRILCTTYGDPVVNGAGQVSDLWNGVAGGYVPDVVLDTGTTLPTMPPC